MVHRSPLIGLCDCNNFFVSCERLFRPYLEDRAVIVLSSNDGCVVSRSNEAKALGIAMGVPFFKVEGLVARHGVVVLSGNIELYQDVSSRVMTIIDRFSDQVEHYSVDEAFFNLSIASLFDPFAYCLDLRRTIAREVGIPVSVGAAPTKTLAKLTAESVKRCAPGVRVLRAEEIDTFTGSTPIEAVWGIGRKTAQKMSNLGIRTIPDLTCRDDDWIRRRFSIREVQTTRELRGQSCFPLISETPPPKSLQVTRSSAEPLHSQEELWDGLMRYVLEGTARLRRQGLCARRMEIFIRTGRYDEQSRFASADRTFDPPTDDDGLCLAEAHRLLEKIFRRGWDYRGTGVRFDNLESAPTRQLTFADADPTLQKRRRLMAALDHINESTGRCAIYPAALVGVNRAATRKAHLSPTPRVTVPELHALLCPHADTAPPVNDDQDTPTSNRF